MLFRFLSAFLFFNSPPACFRPLKGNPCFAKRTLSLTKQAIRVCIGYKEVFPLSCNLSGFPAGGLQVRPPSPPVLVIYNAKGLTRWTWLLGTTRRVSPFAQ